jgi:hypothetical protein
LNHYDDIFKWWSAVLNGDAGFLYSKLEAHQKSVSGCGEEEIAGQTSTSTQSFKGWADPLISKEQGCPYHKVSVP